MGRFVNSGNSAFQVALNSEIYVDKTGLLAYTNKVMDTTAKFICNSRPRRFGKSITADMLTAYYCKNCNSEEMFSSLEISQIPDFRKYLNQYDVIHLDIQWCMEPAGGPENVVSYITQKTIQELKNYYPETLPETINSLPEALSCINTVTGQKFVVIIDEWDVLIREEETGLFVSRLILWNQAFLRACSMSAIISSTFSIPTERRIIPGDTPASTSCSSFI